MAVGKAANINREAYSYRSDDRISTFDDSQPIIVFDGNCALCSGWIKFVLKHYRKARFNFIIAQSALGEALYAHYGLKSEDYDTNILLKNGRVRVKLDGTLAMFAVLGWPWKALNIFRIVPNSWRDKAYAYLCLLYTSPSPRDLSTSRMPSSA